jgi:hypothetical protein
LRRLRYGALQRTGQLEKVLLSDFRGKQLEQIEWRFISRVSFLASYPGQQQE